jgi:predicted RNase H-like nuclease (RuvC/YqgF family)
MSNETKSDADLSQKTPLTDAEVMKTCYWDGLFVSAKFARDLERQLEKQKDNNSYLSHSCDELERQLEIIEEQKWHIKALKAACLHYKLKNKDLERQLAEARKDTERLVWLDDCEDMQKWEDVKELLMTHPYSVRQAIDNAMEETK